MDKDGSEAIDFQVPIEMWIFNHNQIKSFNQLIFYN